MICKGDNGNPIHLLPCCRVLGCLALCVG